MGNFDFDVFIAYSLSGYKTSIDAKEQTSYKVAENLRDKLVSKGYNCFLMEPNNSKEQINKTRDKAKKSKFFIIAVSKITIERAEKESGKIPTDAWLYNELTGFMENDKIQGKEGIAKDYIRAYTDDISINDEIIMKLHDAIRFSNPIREDKRLFEWLDYFKKSFDSNEKIETNLISQNAGVVWTEELADFWDKVCAPARPSESEIEFYRREISNIKKDNPNPRALLLGSTKSLIELALSENLATTIVDSSEKYSKNILKKLQDSRTDLNTDFVKCIYSDWSEMHSELEGKYDIILGDMSIGNIIPNKFERTIKSISECLTERGIWLGKNLFYFTKKINEQNVKQIIKNLFDEDEELSEQKIFAETVFGIASLSCEDSYDTYNEFNFGYNLMTFEKMIQKTKQICDRIKKETRCDCSVILKAYEKYKELHDNNIIFYIYHLKDFVAETQKSGVFLREVWYGNDVYSKDFPLLVLKKENNNIYKDKFTSDKIEYTRSRILDFISNNRDKTFVRAWSESLPSQYYWLRLSKDIYPDKKNSEWIKTTSIIKEDITKVVNFKLEDDLFCYIDVDEKEKNFNDEKMNSEVDYIKGSEKLNDEEKYQMKFNYQMGVLLYLSSELIDSNKRKIANSLYTLVLKKLFDPYLYDDSRSHCWYPRQAPWVTAKICAATNGVQIPNEPKKKIIKTVEKIIDNYELNEHNWKCEVGSHMDTCALCIEAILCYYHELEPKMQSKAQKCFNDILITYVTDRNIYETIILHPIGEYAKQKIEIENKGNIKTNELYQKKVLGSVAFFTSLLKIINFLKKENPTLKFKEEYKYIILDKLTDFWDSFQKMKENDYEKIGEKDICTIPQILYLLSDAFKSEIEIMNESNSKS